MSINRRPESKEYNPYYGTYISKVKGNNFIKNLQEQKFETLATLSKLSDEMWDHKYAPEKWTIKEVMIHIMDAERIFVYRALRVARNDQTPMPGFEQNDYIPFYNTIQRSGSSIMAEYESVRNSTILLFENLSEEDWGRLGEASGSPVSVLALGYMIAGHELHHVQLLHERYFKG
ncbi:MAG: DinB family protein [Saprospiraceae bacterium]